MDKQDKELLYGFGLLLFFTLIFAPLVEVGLRAGSYTFAAAACALPTLALMYIIRCLMLSRQPKPATTE